MRWRVWLMGKPESVGFLRDMADGYSYIYAAKSAPPNCDNRSFSVAVDFSILRDEEPVLRVYSAWREPCRFQTLVNSFADYGQWLALEVGQGAVERFGGVSKRHAYHKRHTVSFFVRRFRHAKPA